MKSYLKIYLSITLTIFLMPAVFTFLVDPFQYFHKHYFTTPRFQINERFQVAGLIRNYLDDKDTIIIGTSLSQNFDLDKFKTMLNWNAINLSAAGAHPVEKKTIAQAALREKNIQHVVWELDKEYLPLTVLNKKPEALFPLYAYEASLVGMWKYLFNYSNIMLSLQMLTTDDREGWRDSYKRYNNFMMPAFNKGKVLKWSSPQNVEALKKELKGPKNYVDKVSSDREKYRKGLAEMLLPVVEQHPEVQFHFFFPPYSTLHYALLRKDQFRDYLQMRRELSVLLAGYKNAKVIALPDETTIGASLYNYIDSSHYHESVNDLLITQLTSKGLDPIAIESSIKELVKARETYDLKGSLSARQNPLFRRRNKIAQHPLSTYYDPKLRMIGLWEPKCPSPARLEIKLSGQGSRLGCEREKRVVIEKMHQNGRQCYRAMYLPKCYTHFEVKKLPSNPPV